MATKKIPYGISDFQAVSLDNFYYVDKTRFIKEIEESPRFLFLIRPRRFGKSLWLNMLKMYYDINAREQFDALFGQYYIGKHPTPEHNSYLILSFNFAQVNPDPKVLLQSFEEHTSYCFDNFNAKYAHLLGEDYLEEYAKATNAGSRLEYVALRCMQAKQPIYLIIDEYDNFTNVVLSRYGHSRYHDLTHGAGFFRFFFNKIKGATTDSGASFKRMFISGVSPVTLDDVTSGFNIASMITLDPRFNEVLGFTESEVREMLEYYKAEGKWNGNTEEILDVMRKWYDNYCFSEECTDVKMYNPDMVLYFMNYLTANRQAPERQFLAHQANRRRWGNQSKYRNCFPGRKPDRAGQFHLVAVLFRHPDHRPDGAGQTGAAGTEPDDTAGVVLVYRAGIPRCRGIQNENHAAGRPDVGHGIRRGLASGVRILCRRGAQPDEHPRLHRGRESHPDAAPRVHELDELFRDFPGAGDQYCYVVEFKYLKHEATDAEVAAKLEEAREQLKLYAGDVKHEQAKGHTTLRRIAVVYRAWEMAALEEV